MYVTLDRLYAALFVVIHKEPRTSLKTKGIIFAEIGVARCTRTRIPISVRDWCCESVCNYVRTYVTKKRTGFSPELLNGF